MDEIKKQKKEEIKLEKKRNKQIKENIKQQKKEAAKEIKLYTFRNWVREIKRVVWPKNAKVWKWFGITIAFLIVMAVFCFLVTLGFTSLWNVIGIKV
ncbi:Hypothetical protein, putative Sec E subunit [Metamycoplasma alkalescens 14918]|uniref:Protein translocase subunit SecE n=1 Tax=Metamycoplasma alkalescens 14918 TaxID=1188234 RepID=N9TZH6_9BACT|nr:preprotein translocase subunit SecE [Metamycoplasma alkalescens]ENY53702.1 Hypothetical protein, putative Sec E subunit [Metamycoplasma alkalescens 14918]